MKQKWLLVAALSFFGAGVIMWFYPSDWLALAVFFLALVGALIGVILKHTTVVIDETAHAPPQPSSTRLDPALFKSNPFHKILSSSSEEALDDDGVTLSLSSKTPNPAEQAKATLQKVVQNARQQAVQDRASTAEKTTEADLKADAESTQDNVVTNTAAKVNPPQVAAPPTESSPAESKPQRSISQTYTAQRAYQGAQSPRGKPQKPAQPDQRPENLHRGLHEILQSCQTALNNSDGQRLGEYLQELQTASSQLNLPLPPETTALEAGLTVLRGQTERETAVAFSRYVRDTLDGNGQYDDWIRRYAKSLPPDAASNLRISLRETVLREHNNAGRYADADRLYYQLEQELDAINADARLIRTYIAHLELKKSMQDIPGQIELIDLIGNRCFKIGDTERAKAFYEQGMELREQLT